MLVVWYTNAAFAPNRCIFGFLRLIFEGCPEGRAKLEHVLVFVLFSAIPVDNCCYQRYIMLTNHRGGLWMTL
nr:MAG TPA_asm: hypothetical protein [Caudoviricetes sp.]